MVAEESELVTVARHVAEARIIVARQQQIVAMLTLHGCSTDGAQETLRQFETTLEELEEHERYVRQRSQK